MNRFSRRSSLCLCSVCTTSNSIRNCSSPTSSTSLRKIRFIPCFGKRRKATQRRSRLRISSNSIDDSEVDELKDGGKGVGVRVTVQVPSVLPIPNDLKRKMRIVEEKRTVAE